MIIDRTLEDVNYAKLHKDSLENLKGNYNYTDANRVETKTQELATKLTNYNYLATTLTYKTNWARTDTFDYNASSRYLGNIQKLRNCFSLKPTTPVLPSNMNAINYEDANNIEKNLVDIEDNLKAMENYFVYCGVANCGQNRMWQNRFRRIELSTPIIMNWSRLSSYETWNDLAEDFEKWGDVIV